MDLDASEFELTVQARLALSEYECYARYPTSGSALSVVKPSYTLSQRR